MGKTAEALPTWPKATCDWMERMFIGLTLRDRDPGLAHERHGIKYGNVMDAITFRDHREQGSIHIPFERSRRSVFMDFGTITSGLVNFVHDHQAYAPAI